eukprot:gene17323-12381_t
MADDRSDLDFDLLILVSRGDELPKKNYEKKKHPTYETSVRIKHHGKNRLTKPHLVVKFFNQYRDLYDALAKAGVGENMKVNIEVPFPPSYKSSLLGVTLTEDQLQERCYMLNKWMQAVFANYPLFSADGQKLISEFLSLDDNDDAGEANKELILTLLRRKQERNSNSNNATVANLPSPPSFRATNNNGNTSSTAAVAASSTSTAVVSSSSEPASAGPLGGQSSVRFAADVNDNSDRPALRLGDANNASSPPRNNSSKFSVYSEAPMLSGAEMEEYSKESFVNSFLAVSVLRGDMIPKTDGDSKLHHSYETIIRVLPFRDVVLDAAVVRDEVDVAVYDARVATIPPISIMKVFDGYRTLMLDLEAMGVFPKDHAHKAQAYDEDDSTRRRSIVIDAPFPKTFRRSSLGINLSEQQLQMRVVMLNNWMGVLLRAFNSLPADAQQAILSFLGITVKVFAATAADVAAAYPDESGGSSDTTEYNNGTLYHMLKGTFVLPKKKVEPPPSKKKDTATSSSTAAANNKTTTTSGEAEPLKEITWINGMNNLVPSNLGPADGLPEFVVNTFVGVKVTQGEKLLRKAGDSKMHSAYEVRIRILTYPELTNPEKKDMDVEQYGRLSRLPPLSVSKVFDGYRTL